jgi:hypothetical protein
MNTYIALLRGINVSGKNIIKMAELKTMFQKLEFEHVETYIQSGNVVFGSDIEGKGCIVTETFKTSSFVSSGDTITINCSHVINKMQDVKGDKEVYFLLRNDKTRKSLKKYPGIRALAVYKKRINKNVKVVQR